MRHAYVYVADAGEPWRRAPARCSSWLLHQVRTRLAWAGFGSLGQGLWISPRLEREREALEAQARMVHQWRRFPFLDPRPSS